MLKDLKWSIPIICIVAFGTLIVTSIHINPDQNKSSVLTKTGSLSLRGLMAFMIVFPIITTTLIVFHYYLCLIHLGTLELALFFFFPDTVQ